MTAELVRAESGHPNAIQLAHDGADRAVQPRRVRQRPTLQHQEGQDARALRAGD